MRLRAATAADAAAIAVFQTGCWREAYAGVVPQSYLDRVTVADREARWRNRLESGSRRVAVAELSGVPIGVVSWGDSDATSVTSVELKSLYVGAAHRGTGVSARLLEMSIGSARAHLWVFEENPRAQRFYGKHGFAFDGHRMVDPDTGLWQIRMARRG